MSPAARGRASQGAVSCSRLTAASWTRCGSLWLAESDIAFQPVWLARAMRRAARMRPEDVDRLIPLDFDELHRFFLDAPARLRARHLPHSDESPSLPY